MLDNYVRLSFKFMATTPIRTQPDHIVISSRIRLARNFDGMCFYKSK